MIDTDKREIEAVRRVLHDWQLQQRENVETELEQMLRRLLRRLQANRD